MLKTVEFADAAEAYWYLNHHPRKGYSGTTFTDALDVMIVRVNPKTRRIDDDPKKNTLVEVWLESGCGYSEPHEVMGSVPMHDPDLDVGAPTFEEAIIKLAERVRTYYGDE